MSIQDSTVNCGYSPPHRMMTFGYPAPANELHSEKLSDKFYGRFTVAKDQYASGDLVSLSWLQRGNILQITPLDNEEDASRENRLQTIQTSEDGAYMQSYTVCEPQTTLSSVGTALSSRISLATTGTSGITSYTSGTNYSNPYCAGLLKPCYSYTHLIFMAIESTPSKCMTVNQIYNWCETNFPFYKHAGAGWKNSLRHNLSINKSFKRLPRDGRGPGRGAYWAVEPRERPNLMDAVKRNPWNVNVARDRALVRSLNCNALNENTLIGNNPFSAINSHGEIQSANMSGYSLSQSTPETLLRSVGVGNCNLLLSNGHSGASSPFSLIETSELKMDSNPSIPSVALQTCVSSVESSQFKQDRSLTNSVCVNTSGVGNEESINVHYSTESSVGSSVYPIWPEEEEEKYCSMLRLMLDSSSKTVDGSSKNHIGQVQSENTHVDASTQGTTKPKKEYVKQRRKSSLNPTIENMCNECKENKASTCRSCQLRLWQSQHSGSSFEASQALLNIGKFNSYIADAALEELLEMLDGDQEAGPACGPALAKKMIKSEDSSAANTDSGEVFITQAPYLDHEYSHCQKHLRRQDENRSVEAYNARYRQDRLHLLRCLAESNANKNLSIQHSGFSISAEESETENSMSIGDEFDSYKHDSSDSDMLPQVYLRPQSSDHVRPRHRPMLETVPIKALSSVRRKRGRPGMKMRVSPPARVLLPKPRRRSSRTIRAPKRPYDNLEEGEEDYDDDDAETLGIDSSLDTEGPYDEEKEMYEMSRYHFNSSLPYTGHYKRRSRLVPQFLPPIASGTQESNRRGKIRKRQVNPDTDDELDRPVVRRRKHYQKETKMIYKSEDIGRHQRDRINSEFFHLKKERKKHRAQNDEFILRPVDNQQSRGLIKDSNSERKPVTENTTVEAAQILLGISQMQNFQRQSGYVNLDSSGASQSSEDITQPATAVVAVPSN